MGKWYREAYINRRNWILANIAKRQLSAAESVLLLLIDFYNEQGQTITVESLAAAAGMAPTEADKVISGLNRKGYLTIVARNHKVMFNIDGLFEGPIANDYAADVFGTFEKEFGRPLTQREMTFIAEWLQSNDAKTVVKALREAMINNKPNVNYIAKILADWGQPAAKE